MSERYAIYHAPEPGSELERLGRVWLRPDPQTDPPPGFTAQERVDLTAPAAFYGLHATLKAPFRLTPGADFDLLDQALADFARLRHPALGPRLALRSLGGFLALVPEGPCPEVDELAWDCVTAFDSFRAPLVPEEIARRRGPGLTMRQDELLLRFGYPYVDDQYRFHMTLTRRLPDLEERASVKERLAKLVKPVCIDPLAVREICLFVQNDRESPFRLVSSHALQGGQTVEDVYLARSLT